MYSTKFIMNCLIIQYLILTLTFRYLVLVMLTIFCYCVSYTVYKARCVQIFMKSRFWVLTNINEPILSKMMVTLKWITKENLDSGDIMNWPMLRPRYIHSICLYFTKALGYTTANLNRIDKEHTYKPTCPV